MRPMQRRKGNLFLYKWERNNEIRCGFLEESFHALYERRIPVVAPTF